MKFAFDLSGKRAVITGGASGIGKAIAETLRAHGAVTTIIDLHAQEGILQNEAPLCYGVQADLSCRDACRDAMAAAIRYMGGVDILVNCAGIIRREDAENFSEKDWDEVINLNLSTTFVMCQLAGREMIRQGHGKIINIASMNAFDGGKRICSYAASKGAVVLLTKSLTNEWCGKGVNINAIAPGYIETPINTFYRTPEGAEAQAAITARIPKGRWGTPADIAGTALFLASDAADYVSGAVIPVDGGYQAN